MSDTPIQIDICSGGNAPAGTATICITLNNHHPVDCHVSNLNLPNANPAPPYTVAARQNSTPGTLTIHFTPIANSYPYSPDCCGPKETQPVIKIQ
jgi:hypothetical protein